MLYGGLVGIALSCYLLSHEALFIHKEDALGYVCAAYAFAFYVGISIVAGWKRLKTISSIKFRKIPLVGWPLYFLLKFAGSLLFGVGTGYGLYRLGNNLVQIRTLQKKMQRSAGQRL